MVQRKTRNSCLETKMRTSLLKASRRSPRNGMGLAMLQVQMHLDPARATQQRSPSLVSAASLVFDKSHRVSTGTRYIPPHLRNRQPETETAEESEAQIKLKRQLKGLLNRLSEQNISSILDGIEEIYRNQRRHGKLGSCCSYAID